MKSRVLILGCLLLSLLFLAGCGRAGTNATVKSQTPATSTSLACNYATQWKPPADNMQLNDLAMISPDEGWAVGNTTASNSGPAPVAPAGVIYHSLNGQWVKLAKMYPNAPLVALSMDSPTDGWAVSTPDQINPGVRALVLHYSLGQWRPVDVPALDAVLNGPSGTGGGFITSISVQMFGANAGWIFAWTDVQRDPSNPNSGNKVVILRYENGVWTPISAPVVKITTEMFALSAVSADEAWIVGTDYGSGGSLTTLFAHYTNGAWSLWPKTFPGVDENFTMLSPTDGWAFDSGGGPSLLLHFDGKTWASVTMPPHWGNPDGQGMQFSSRVYAISADVTWFGGYTRASGPGTSTPEPVLEQYSHGAWQEVAWPFSTVVPMAMMPVSRSADVRGVGDIEHQEGCAPAMVTDVEQGMFLQFQQGHWTEQVLP
jgi:hypothetical protein